MFSIIPTPKVCRMGEVRVTLPANTSGSCFPEAVATLAELAKRMYGVSFAPAEGDAGIIFSLNRSLPEESYTLTVGEQTATITASANQGAQHGVATLLQLMEICAEGIVLPMGTIEDAPDCSWRGVMVDLARAWHEPSVLYQYVDMCHFFKLRYLHLHFTDDQSYTLPSKAYPNLSTKDRHYTEEELRGLIRYAESRGVELIPEIDVPGHCTSFAEAYGDIFGRNGIICQSEEAMQGMETVFRELCELFDSSAYIHVGGDEAAIAKWTECPATMAAYRAQGYDVDGMDKGELAEIMYATFVARTCEAVTACGKTPVVWEGFHESVNHLIPKNAVVMSWENFYQTTPQLQKSGFRLINCSWSPMYVVTPAAYWSLEEVYGWSIYTWRPVHPGSPYLQTGLNIEPTQQVEGGQLLAWGDHIVKRYENVADGVREEQHLMEERAVALSQNTWQVEKQYDYATFAQIATRVMERYALLKGE